MTRSVSLILQRTTVIFGILASFCVRVWMFFWEGRDRISSSRLVSFQIACILLPTKPLIYNTSMYWQGRRARLSKGEMHIPKERALIVQPIVYLLATPQLLSLGSCICLQVATRLCPGDQAQAECGHWDSNSQSHQQEPLEKVEDAVPRGMLSGATGILILHWELSWSSWSSANAMWAQGVAQMTIDVPGYSSWGGAWSWEISMGLCIQRCVTSIPHYLPSSFCMDLRPRNSTAGDEHLTGNV